MSLKKIAATPLAGALLLAGPGLGECGAWAAVNAHNPGKPLSALALPQPIAPILPIQAALLSPTLEIPRISEPASDIPALAPSKDSDPLPGQARQREAPQSRYKNRNIPALTLAQGAVARDIFSANSFWDRARLKPTTQEPVLEASQAGAASRPRLLAARIKTSAARLFQPVRRPWILGAAGVAAALSAWITGHWDAFSLAPVLVGMTVARQPEEDPREAWIKRFQQAFPGLRDGRFFLAEDFPSAHRDILRLGLELGCLIKTVRNGRELYIYPVLDEKPKGEQREILQRTFEAGFAYHALGQYSLALAHVVAAINLINRSGEKYAPKEQNFIEKTQDLIIADLMRDFMSKHDILLASGPRQAVDAALDKIWRAATSQREYSRNDRWGGARTLAAIGEGVKAELMMPPSNYAGLLGMTELAIDHFIHRATEGYDKGALVSATKIRRDISRLSKNRQKQEYLQSWVSLPETLLLPLAAELASSDGPSISLVLGEQLFLHPNVRQKLREIMRKSHSADARYRADALLSRAEPDNPSLRPADFITAQDPADNLRLMLDMTRVQNRWDMPFPLSAEEILNVARAQFQERHKSKKGSPRILEKLEAFLSWAREYAASPRRLIKTVLERLEPPGTPDLRLPSGDPHAQYSGEILEKLRVERLLQQRVNWAIEDLNLSTPRRNGANGNVAGILTVGSFAEHWRPADIQKGSAGEDIDFYVVYSGVMGDPAEFAETLYEVIKHNPLISRPRSKRNEKAAPDYRLHLWGAIRFGSLGFKEELARGAQFFGPDRDNLTPDLASLQPQQP